MRMQVSAFYLSSSSLSRLQPANYYRNLKHVGKELHLGLSVCRIGAEMRALKMLLFIA